MKKIIIAALLAFAAMCGCSQTPAQDIPTPPPVREVYSDGVVSIEAGEPVRVGDYGFLQLTVTNGGTVPMVLCSTLGVRVRSLDGADYSCSDMPAAAQLAREQIASYASLDGLISPGNALKGYICFKSPGETSTLIISLATDFGADKWAEFECFT